MKDKRTSIDGFIPRRPGSQLGDLHDEKKRAALKTPVYQALQSDDDTLRETVGQRRVGQGIGRSDIDESLRSIGTDEPTKKLSRRQRRRLGKGSKKPRSKTRRILKWVGLVLLVALLAFGGYIAYRAIHASGNIFQGNILDVLTQKQVPLQQDDNGRTNILILGTSQDDPGHDAGNLTDSMMILSVDQNNKNAYMISVPRDLYVQYGEACDSGYRGKINVYYSCVGGDGTSVDGDRAALTKTAGFVGDIFGLNIQYGVNVNYTVFRDIVNAVGGSITVTIESRDAAGQMDSNFDWKCGATTKARLANCPPHGHYIDYPNGPVTLDAEHALYLAQARGDAYPTYGFEQSNFDREKNQQKIITAIRDKAQSVGVLTNLGKVSSILDSLGNNLRTTFQADEVKTLVSLAENIKDADIHSISLVDGDTAVMTTGNVDGQSVVRPIAGTYDYTDLQAIIAKKLSSDPVVREGASIVVLNGSGVPGVAQTKATALKALGYTVTDVGDADTTNYTGITIYQVGTGMPETKTALEKLYGVTVLTTKPPVSPAAGTNFVIIVGATKTTSN